MKKNVIAFSLMVFMAVGIAITFVIGNRDVSSLNQDNTTQEIPSNDDDNKQVVAEDITATLAVCGDIMSHMPQTNDAWSITENKYDYSTMISGATEWVSKADYAVANLETTFAGGPDYSGYPAFNTPDELSDALKQAGFDMLLTANNHSMDRGYDGLVRTLDVLDERGIAHVGTYRTQEERDKNSGVLVADVGGISVAFLGYTYGTNGIPVADDKMFSINLFNTDYMTNTSNLDREKLLQDLNYAESLNTDLIAVMIHWGTEYQIQQNSYQQEVAQFLFDNGADIILGGHPHVLQSMKLYIKTEQNGEQTQGFICYSLGNFISAQKDRYTDTTVVLNLELEKDGKTGKSQVKSYNYIPMLMLNRGSGADVRFELLDVYKTLSQNLDDTQLNNRLNQAITDCHNILGENEDKGKIAA